MDGFMLFLLVVGVVLSAYVYIGQRQHIRAVESELIPERAHSDRLATMLEEYDVARRTTNDVMLTTEMRSPANRVFAQRQRKESWGYVYLMSMNDEYHKIGYARKVDERLREMQVASPYRIKVVHMIATGHAPRLETILQNRFADRWVTGEWFKLTDEDIAAVCAISGPVTSVDMERLFGEQ